LTNTVQQTSEAEEYLVLDPQGRVRLATVQEHDGAFLPNIDFFKRGARARRCRTPTCHR
jgi:hypothetical protein